MSFWDTAFDYDTVKFVRIHSKVLGILHYAFLLGIVLYLSISVFGFQKKYLKVEVPSGTARLSIFDPCVPTTDQDYCQIGGSTKEGVTGPCLSHQNFRCDRHSYCAPAYTTLTAASSGAGGQLPCRYWDHNSLSWPPSESKAITIGTRAALYHQQLRNKHNASCPNQSELDCQWYPPVQDSRANATQTERQRSYYLGDIGNFTLRLYHQATTPSVGGTMISAQMNGRLMRCKDGNQCNPNSPSSDYEELRDLPSNGFADVLRVQDLLDASSTVEKSDRSGIDLDVASDSCPDKCQGELNSYRYVGLVFALTIVYDNTGLLVPESDAWSGIGTGTARYQVRVNALKSSKFNVQVVQHGGTTNTHRTIHHIHGIRFVVAQTGNVGAFDFNTLLLQLTTSVAMIAVATVVVDFLLQHVMPDRAKYTEFKFQEETVEDEHSLFGAVIGAATMGYVDPDEESEDENDLEKRDSGTGAPSEHTPLLPSTGAPSEHTPLLPPAGDSNI